LEAAFPPLKRISLSSSLARLLLCCAAANAAPACVKLPRRAADTAPNPPPAAQSADSARVNLNHASRAELERLPGVGPGLAERIVEHRERHGPFRRAEHLMSVHGFSERRFRELRHLVTVE
jgi:competence protein ComEA